MLVSTPGSTANLGPGFDCLALAVDRRYELSTDPLDGFRPVGAHDLVWVALQRTGAEFDGLWFRSAIPEGRGLGSSAAACVAAAYLGYRDRGVDRDAALASAFAVAAEIEDHPDNAAASTYGGLNLVADGRVHTRTPTVREGALHVWTPRTVELTRHARARVVQSVSLADAVAQAAACAAVFAGLVTGSWELMGAIHADRLHEAARLAALPETRSVVEALRGEGHLAWLSGSGPSVGVLLAEGTEELVPAAGGEWLPLAVDHEGCTERT